MRSPRSKRARGDPDDSFHTVQDTLDAFETEVAEHAMPPPLEGSPEEEGTSFGGPSSGARQASIEAFLGAGAVPPESYREEGSRRAMEGLALEMAMERIALTEASSGIQRDELLLTIAREIQLPLARLDLVDGYISDLELEGKLWRVGDVVVLTRPEARDLLSMDLPEEEFLEKYRRRYATARRGDEG